MTTTEREDREVGFKLAFGTYEEAKAMLGARSDVSFAPNEVNWPMIKLYCALTEDANASYWDEEFARQTWGSIIAPPGMLLIWTIPNEWQPGGGLKEQSPSLAFEVPLPGSTLINISTETEFLSPFRVGDHLNMVEEFTDLSPEKTTRVGTGHFVTTVGTFRNQRGEVVARNINVVFRFEPGAN